MASRLFTAFCIHALFLIACSSDVQTATTSGAGGQSSTGTSSTGTSTSTGTGGGGGASGDCTNDGDCPGGQCVPLAPGGYKVCTHFPAEVTNCPMPPGPFPDECCTSADCPMGKCYSSSTLPGCSGSPNPLYTLCIVEYCSSDDDCIHDNPEPWICLPAGAFGFAVRSCFTAYCHTNADCTAKGGGSCVPIPDPCCSVPQGIACVYAGGCTKDADCASDGSQRCAIDHETGSAICKPGFTGCPG